MDGHQYFAQGKVGDFLGDSVIKNPPANAGDAGLIRCQEDLLEKEIATPSCILAWKIPRTEEPVQL